MEEIALKHKQICFLINRFAVPSARQLRAGLDWPTLQKIGAQVSQLDDKNKVLIFQNWIFVLAYLVYQNNNNKHTVSYMLYKQKKKIYFSHLWRLASKIKAL